MTRKILKSVASFELILAAGLWGFGFIGVTWALQAWDPAQIIFYRFLIGAVFGLGLSLPISKPRKIELLWQARASFMPAFWLWLTLFLQTWGLRYTTATKSGMITILYVVIVPLFEAVFARKRIPLVLWICTIISLTGVYLIVQPGWDANWNRGDLLTLLCAITAALQILSIDRISGAVEHGFLFNAVQSVWGGLFAALALPVESASLIPKVAPNTHAWIGLLSLGFGSTLIAFYLQVKSQKVLSPTVSSLFFLLESPFALLFAFMFLGEQLNGWQGAGAVLIMLSAFASTLVNRRENNNP